MAESPAQTLLQIEAIFLHASLGIVFSQNRVMTRCNPAFTKMFGYSPGQLDACPAKNIFRSEEDYQAFAKKVSGPLSAGLAISETWSFQDTNGKELICQIRGQAIDASPNEEGTVWLFEDITQSQHQSLIHAQTTLEFEAVMNNAPIGIIFTANRKITRCNSRFCQMFGYTSETILGQYGRILFDSDAAYAELGSIVGPRLSSGLPITHEMPMTRADGSTFWAQMIAYVVNPQNTQEGTIWLISDRTEARQQEESMRNALFENEALLNNVVVGIVFLKSRRVQRCNRQAERIFGYAPGSMLGQSTRDWYGSEEDFELVGRDVYPALARGETQVRERWMRRQDGSKFVCRIAGKLSNINDPIGGGSIWVIEDVSDRHATQAALISATSLIQGVFNSANVSIIATDPNGLIRLFNSTAERWLGYRAEDMIDKQTPALIHDPLEVVAYAKQLSQELGELVEPGFDTFIVKARRDVSDEHEWSYIRADGSRFPVHLTTSVLRDNKGQITGYIGVGIDITDRKMMDAALQQAQAELEERVAQRTAELAEINATLQLEIAERHQVEATMRHMAHYDSLTGLPNRNLLHERLTQALVSAKRHSKTVGLMFIDLDRFKHINDSLGHETGDQLLSQVALRMSYVLRDSDTLARIGGDEFVLLVPEFNKPNDLTIVADKILDILSQPIPINTHSLHITPSIGICCYPQDGEDTETLMRNADTAMYHAKAAGRNNYQFFANNMNLEADERFHVEAALRYAIRKNELALHYQPLIDNQENRICGVEALLRWNSVALGPVPPSKFISIAEDNGTIVQIGSWALREACKQGQKWRDEGHTDLVIAVNLSPLQFRQKDLVQMVRQTLEETGFPATSLELEITESSLINNVDEVIQKLHELVALGLRLAIDDFGTGYSSLAYLKHFPVHKLKIDQSFVRDLESDEHTVGIVQAVIALAKSLHLDVLAEGVETSRQHQLLQQLGCRYLQGYHFSRPVSAAVLPILLCGDEEQDFKP